MRTWKIRMCLVVAAALPVSMMVFLGPVQAQFRGPNNPPNFNQPKFPNINQPKFPNINQPNFPNINPPTFNQPNIMKTWICSKCGASLGNGAFPVGQCPSCKARIVNGVGGGAVFQNPPQTRPFVPVVQGPPVAASSSGSGTVGYVLGAFAGLGMMIGGIITALKCGGVF